VKEHHVNCPYCGTLNKVFLDDDYLILWPHPPNFYSPSKNQTPSVSIFYFWSIWNFKKCIPSKEIVVTCTSCFGDFHVEADLGDYHTNLKYEKHTNKKYYIDLCLGKTQIIEKKVFLERILDRLSIFLNIDYKYASFLFVMSLFFLFYFLPICLLGGYSKIICDPNIFILAIITSIVLIAYKYNLNLLRISFNLKDIESDNNVNKIHSYHKKVELQSNSLPILLDKNYKNSNFCRVFEELTLKGNILGHPFSKIAPSTILGLLFTITYLIWHFNALFLMDLSLFETNLPEYPTIYNSIISGIFIGIYNGIAYFIIGNTLWIFLSTTIIIGLLTRYIPIKIDLLKEMGGTGNFGLLMLSSVIPISIIGFGMPFVIWNINTLTQLINDPAQQIIGYAIVIILELSFVVLIIIGFFYPLIPIHRLIKFEKKTVLNDLIKKPLPDNRHLYEKLRFIQSIQEWPFKIDIFLKFLSYLMFPLISMTLSILMFI